jgi:hypothetical protein
MSDDYRWQKTYNVDDPQNEPYRPHTLHKLQYDNDNLYVAFVCEKAGGKVMHHPGNNDIWDSMLGSHLEFCVMSPQLNGLYYHISITHSGKVYSALTTNPTLRDLNKKLDFTYVIKDEKNLAHRKDLSKTESVFVPSSYDGVTPHDVLYFFDAQNLFCGAGHYTDNGDPYGSWQVDVVLSEIYRQYGKNIIVVGIDNADEYRSNELFMNPKDFGALAPLATAIPEDNFSVGYLEGLSSFMVGTLHSFIPFYPTLGHRFVRNNSKIPRTSRRLAIGHQFYTTLFRRNRFALEIFAWTDKT